MSLNLDLKKADQKVFTAAFEDGLVDIFIACVVLMFAVAPFLSRYLGDFWSSAIFLPFWGIVFLILWWIRRSLVKPRAGVVKFSPTRTKKMSIFSGIMLVLNLIFMILGIISSLQPDSPGWTKILPFCAMVLLSFSLAGYFLDLRRLYIYGIMLGTAPLVGEYLYQTFAVVHHGYPITFGLSAVIIFGTGMAKLITFLRDNPLPSDEIMQWGENNG